MTGGTRCRAVYAGLMGLMAATLPIPAQAATMSQADGSLVAMTLPPFAIGCAAGATVALAVSRRRHDEPRIERADAADEADARSARASDAGHAPAPAAAGSPSRHAPRHLRSTDWESTGNIRVQAYVADEPAAEPAPAAHAATDYAQIAENYVRRMTIREVMATRARGVRDVLADRLGHDPMEGMPVITRADGSTGDVGTAWWNAAVGDRIRTALPDDLMDDTAQRLVDRDVDPAPVAASRPTPASGDADPTASGEDPELGAVRAHAIVSRVAYVEQDLYPETRPAEADGASRDVWQQALDAMDDRASVVAAQPFEDVVGGLDTIDDPEGLEDSTSFIPFRTPAGHPEVVDRESYVDYLIDDEFSRNRSDAARRSSRDFLRVIEGGSQKARRMFARGGSEGRRGAHFAEAQEA